MIKLPKNFIDPHAQEQLNNYDTPIHSREAILEILRYQKRVVTIKELQTLYPSSQMKSREALVYRLKAMAKSGQIYLNQKEIYLIENLNQHLSTVLVKRDSFFVSVPGHNQPLALTRVKNTDVIAGDRVLYALSPDHQQAIYLKHQEYKSVYLEGHLQQADEFDLPDDCTGVVCISTFGPYENQYISLKPTNLKPIDKADQQKVLVKIDREDTSEFIKAELVRIDKSIPAKIREVIYQKGLHHLFPEDALIQADKLSSRVTSASTHKDLTSLNFVTIDGPTAKDFDDAVYAQKTEKGFDLYVAIADVSSYVPEDSPLCKEAQIRGVSVYFPRYVIPMLPEKLSNNLCSLRPQRLRKTLTCKMSLSDGSIESFEFFPAMIRSKARLTYQQVQEHKVPKKLTADIENLWSVYRLLKKKRAEKGYLIFDSQAPYFEFNEKGEVTNIKVEQGFESCRLIEEMMLAANICSAQFLNQTFKGQGVYRVHPAPTWEKVQALNEALKAQNLHLKNFENIDAINQFAQKIREKTPELSSLTARLMQRASYEVSPEPHFGLNEELYSHFTSPIRRYPDLWVHRLIYRALKIRSSPVCFEKIDCALSKVNFLERRAEESERLYHQILKVLFAQKLSQKKILKATVMTVMDFGVFVETEGHHLDGLIAFAQCDHGYFDVIAGEAVSCQGARFFVGQKVNVCIESVDTVNYRINFKLVSWQK